METILMFLTRVFVKQRYAKVMACLILMAFGISNGEINKKLGVSFPTLRKYRSALESKEIEGLFEFKGSRTKSEINDFEDIILNDFDANPPKTLRDAQERIQKLTGLKRSLNRVRVWLKKRAYEVGQ